MRQHYSGNFGKIINYFNSRTSCEVRLQPSPEYRQRGYFNSRTSCEVRQAQFFRRTKTTDFNSRTSCEVRPRIWKSGLLDSNFNSRTSCEVRLDQFLHHAVAADFNSRTSCEVRLRTMRELGDHFTFQLTHLLRGATSSFSPIRSTNAISTHAPLARCDTNSFGNSEYLLISTHAPLARCDARSHTGFGCQDNFNSRTSCEVRRDGGCITAVSLSYFNSRTSCEVRPAASGNFFPPPRFQLTHLLRGATRIKRNSHGQITFQLTHLLRGATGSGGSVWCDVYDFNSRTSCEVRRVPSVFAKWIAPFQLTHLLRGATNIQRMFAPPRY